MTQQEEADKILEGSICAYCHVEFIEKHEYAVLCDKCYPQDKHDLPIQLYENRRQDKIDK